MAGMGWQSVFARMADEVQKLVTRTTINPAHAA